MSEAHTCPVEGCSATVTVDRLMCYRHWGLVPKHAKDEVWRTYRSAPGSREHLGACAVAVGYAQDHERNGPRFLR